LLASPSAVLSCPDECSTVAIPSESSPKLAFPDIDFWEFAVEGGGVVARPDFKGLFLVNPTALEIWRNLRAGATAEATATRLSSTFGIPVDIALRDVKCSIQTWQEVIFAARLSPGPVSLPERIPLPEDEIAFDCSLRGTSFRILLSSSDLAGEIIPRLESLQDRSLASPDVTLRLVHSNDQIFVSRVWGVGHEEFLSVQDHPTYARIVLLNEIARLAGPRQHFLALLHAGACGSDSKCLIFPAATHSGKSTLAAVLMASGLTMYADDSVALHPDNLTVAPMPFALMIREGSWPVVSAHFPMLRNLPTHHRYGETVKFLPPANPAPNTHAQACAVIFSRWEANAVSRTQRLTTFDALLRLQESGFWVAHTRPSIQKFLDWLARLPVFDLVYSDVDDAVAFITDLLQKEGRAGAEHLPS